MTLKDGIKKTIDDFFEEWECPSNQVYSQELANKISDALVVDEKQVVSELLSRCSWFLEYQDGNRSAGSLRIAIAKAIAETKPIGVKG